MRSASMAKNMSPATLLAKLNELGGKHGCGRLDLVEGRFVRYEVPWDLMRPPADIAARSTPRHRIDYPRPRRDAPKRRADAALCRADL